MTRLHRVILYGNSVIVGTVAASLARYPDLEVVGVSPPVTAAKELAALEPDVIIFDVEAGHPEPAFALLKDCPRLLLVGVSPETDQLMLWSSGKTNALSTEDLVKVISVEPQADEKDNAHDHHASSTT